MFFESWAGVVRTIIVGISAYAVLILLLRISGKRTLSKMNAFDFVVTVALGSTLATVMLSKDTPLAEGILALALLILLQFVITWLSVRSKTVSNIVKAEPRLLYHGSEFLREAMKAERVNEEEILQAMRSQGFSGPEEVGAVVLETNGNLNIIRNPPDNKTEVLSSVTGLQDARSAP